MYTKFLSNWERAKGQKRDQFGRRVICVFNLECTITSNVLGNNNIINKETLQSAIKVK